LIIIHGARQGDIAKILNDKSVLTHEIVEIFNSKKNHNWPVDLIGAPLVKYGDLEIKTTDDLKFTNKSIKEDIGTKF